MKKSLIVTHIANCDYPIWRAWLRKYSFFFDEIIICWDVSFRFPFYNAFIQQSLQDVPHIRFLDMPQRELGVDDWRNKSTNYLVKNATGDWLFSIEQDWFAKDWNHLLGVTEFIMDNADMGGWMNETAHSYIHPAYWFIKRDLLEKTGKDFSAHSEIAGADHFAMITYKAQELGAKIVSLQDKGIKTAFAQESDAFHLGGVNQNYLDFEARIKNKTIHRAEAFYVYNQMSLVTPVVKSEEFEQRCLFVQKSLYKLYPSVDVYASAWKPFFTL